MHGIFTNGCLWHYQWYHETWRLFIVTTVSIFPTRACYLYPTQRSWRGYIGFTLSVCPSVRLPVCGQHHVCSVSSTILAGSISYLPILSTNFRRCIACYHHSFNFSKIYFSTMVPVDSSQIISSGFGKNCNFVVLAFLFSIVLFT